MFCLLRNPELATEIITTPDCVLDRWSLNLRSPNSTCNREKAVDQQNPDLGHEAANSISTMVTPWLEEEEVLQTVGQIREIHCCQHKETEGVSGMAKENPTTWELSPNLVGSLLKMFVQRTVNLCLFQSPIKVVKQLKRKHVGGGTFRAFISRVFTGKQGSKPDFKGISADYWEHVRNQDASFQQDRAVGQAARMVAYHKDSQNRGSNFGPSQRSLQRAAAKNAQRLFWERCRHLDDNARSEALVEFAQSQGMGLKALVAMARSQHRQDGQALVKAVEENIQAIVAYQASVGQEALGKVAAALPGMQLSKDTLTPVPSELGHVFEVHPPDTEKVSKTMAWAAASHSTNVATAFQQQWLINHRTVECDHCEPVEDQPPEPNECREAGRCLCGNEGSILKAIKANVLNSMKMSFKGKQRGMLMDGNIVLQLNGKVRDGSNTEDLVQHWLYVSAMYLRPYRPTYELLMPYSGEDLCGDALESRLLLEAPC
eukprot:6482121-Amphidinium_carterae.1